MILQPGDVVEVRPGSQKRPYFRDLKAADEAAATPNWLVSDGKTLSGKVMRLPERSEIDSKLNEQLIVEYYSR
jgi:small subunit ribosomal protein S4